MNLGTTTFTNQLIETVGQEYLLENPADCAAYAVQGVVPTLVATPASVDELAQVLAAAYAAQAALVPWGGGTRQSWGRPPERLDLVVRTERLNQVVEHEPADLTISLQAGMTMAALYAALAPHGQMLPVDVALPARSTVGGALATAADGPRRLGYGTLRDMLIGIQVVEATGRISKAGGMVVKNVSGFDMMKLYLGSHGTLALIVGANFKLLPRPRASATILCSFARRDQALRLADMLHASQLGPVATEYLGGYTIQFAGTRPAITSSSDLATTPHYLAVWAEGLPTAVERQRRDVTRMAHESGAAEVEVAEGSEHNALWAAIADLPQTAEVAAGELALRLTCLPAELLRALDGVHATARRYGMRVVIAARALSGVAYLRISGDFSRPEAFQRELLSRWPNLTVTACDAALKPRLAVWGSTIPGLDLMRRIKQEFDPTGILSPGRFVV